MIRIFSLLGGILSDNVTTASIANVCSHFSMAHLLDQPVSPLTLNYKTHIRIDESHYLLTEK